MRSVSIIRTSTRCALEMVLDGLIVGKSRDPLLGTSIL